MTLPARSYAAVEICLHARSANALGSRVAAAGGTIEAAGIDGLRIVRVPADKASVINLVAHAGARESGGGCAMVASGVSVEGFETPPKPLLKAGVVRHVWRRECGLTPARFLAQAFERASADALDRIKSAERTSRAPPRP